MIAMIYTHSNADRRAKTWLQIVVLHRVGRYFQSQQPTESLEDLPIDSLLSQPPSQEEAVLFKEWEELVDIARGELTKREQELWTFCAGEGEMKRLQNG